MDLIRDCKQYEYAKSFNVTNSSLLNKITLPLEKYFGFRLFTYRRIYDDGTIFHLCSNSQWIDTCFDKELWVSQKMHERSRELENYESKQFLWIHDFADPLYYQLHSYNIWNGVSYYKRYPNYTELIAFSSHKENNSVMDFYIRDEYILKKFIYYFKEQIKNLLDQASNFQFSLNYNTSFLHNSLLQEKKNNFFQECLPKRYYITDGEHGYLTPKEMDVVMLCLQGKTSKEIALELLISPRTVEDYVEGMKQKFNFTSKTALIEFFRKTL